MSVPLSRCLSAAANAALLSLIHVAEADGPPTPEADGVDLTTTAPAAAIHFADQTPILGFAQNKRTWAIAWTDYDNDGWIDVFLNNHTGAATLLRNAGGMSFSDVSSAAGLNVARDHHNCHWADFDNDDDLDLYCTTGGKKGTGSVPANFWMNHGNGQFTDIAQQYGVTNGPGRGRSVNWLDADGDGDLDLFVGNRVSEVGTPASILYRNDGSRFNEIASVGTALPGRVTLSSAFDYDADGDADLLLAYQAYDKPGSPCVKCLVILQNDGSGDFIALDGRTIGLGAGHLINTISIGDYDNDGDDDLFVSGSGSSTKHIYRNNGNGSFSEASVAAAGLSAAIGEKIRQSILADFDNNGALDLFLLIADDPEARPEMLFLGDGHGGFVNATTGAGLGGNHAGQSDVAAAADFDNDGFLDVLIGNGAGPVQGPYQLFRNGGNANRSLRVRLKGAPRVTALGSRILIESAGGIQSREYADQSEGHAFHEPIAHFGVGQDTPIGRLQVSWPDGSVTELHDIPADQVMTVEYSQQPGNHAPMVSIDAPIHGAGYAEGENVSFSGTATDFEDGELTELLGWKSNRDGVLHTGASFETTMLSAGTHVVTASASDSTGLTGSAMVSVSIEAAGNVSPTVSIESPADHSSFDASETVNFAGTASDAEDGSLSEELAWRSSRDGFLASASAFSSSDLSTGSHAITADVTDSAGATGTSTIQIEIRPVGDEAPLILTDTADAFTNQAKGTRKFGGKELMRVHGPGEKKLSFVQFDVSGLTGSIASAVLNLHVQQVVKPGVLRVHGVEGPWEERQLTDNNKPPYGPVVSEHVLSNGDDGTWLRLDVTDLVRQWASSPSMAYGVVLSSPDCHVILDTRETSDAPTVEVLTN